MRSAGKYNLRITALSCKNVSYVIRLPSYGIQMGRASYRAGISNSRDRIRVTLNDKGSFYLNPTAIKSLGEPDAVDLLFDRKQSIIES